MRCLKCGREVEEGLSFCPECKADMARHPVKSNAVVLLPTAVRNPTADKAAARRNAAPSQEQTLQRIKRRLRWSIWCNGVLVLLLAAAIVACFWFSRPTQQPPTGQNYTAIPSSQSSDGK